MSTAAGPDVAEAAPAKKPKRSSASGDETKARILAATLETLKNEGIVGTSARAIARVGDFNQALIFYHFGSVDDAIIAAVGQLSSRRLENHREKLEVATTLPELIRVARALHEEDSTNDNMTVLVQAFAGASGDPEMGPKLYTQLEPWSVMVSDSVERISNLYPSTSNLPTEQIAHAISAMFLGIELLDSLDPGRTHAGAIFDSLESLAGLVDDLLATPLLEMLLPEKGTS